ncbi:caspase family protein [Pseudophaeobacter sp.]|uniref:caspase family protein n=1 Tax=Pseudophaeobacter sp. TaxID=1971739 RepID=UPI00329867C1
MAGFLKTLAIVACLTLPQMAEAARDKIALVIGMANYQFLPPLQNTLKDANGMAQSLENIGFDVTLSLDSTTQDMTRVLEDFAFRSEVADLALIYFAGHGVEVQGENFLLPIDVKASNNRDIQRQSASLKQLLAAVDNARKMRIVILDSCRDNPLGDEIDLDTVAEAQAASDQTRGGGGGMAAVDPDRGTLVAFAARDGQVALDGTGDNSPYAEALMKKMAQPGLEISLMFRQVRDLVLEKTGNLQEPHTYGSLTGVPFYLSPADGGADSVGTSEAWSSMKPDQEEQLLALADLGDTRSMLGLAYMRLNPNVGRFDPVAAVSFLQRAADAGAPEAQFELAKLYERGTGVAADPQKALELYQAAALQNFPDAINDLGFLHHQGGLGLSANPQKAYTFFQRAAELRHPQAQFNFAALIDDGLVPGKGPEEAAGFLYAALRSGSTDVLNLLSERPNMFKLETRRALQNKLQEHKFYQGSIDGDFGPGTQRGIRRAYGLED